MANVQAAWAKDKHGKIVHVSQVKNGLKCECTCVDCGSRMIAYQNGSKAKHFGHESASDCKGESALHAAAKQIILEAASNGETLHFPDIKVSASYVDVFNEEHLPPHSTIEFSISDFSAQAEVKRNDIVADVICQSKSGEFAVEIFYRHQKDEYDRSKFEALNLESFEIDISDVEWDIRPEEFRAHVLHTAQRKWIHTTRIQTLESVAQQELIKQVDTENKLKFRAMEEWIESFVEQNGLAWLESPLLSASAANKDHLGVMREMTENQPLRVTRLIEKFEAKEDQYIYKASVEIQNKTNVYYYFVPAGFSGFMDDDKPHLIQKYSFIRDFPYKEDLSWQNIENWQKKLKRRVTQNLNDELAKYKLKSDRIKQMNHMEKLEHFCAQLGSPSPLFNSSKNWYNRHWGTHNFIWQALVFRSFVRKRDSFSTDKIATNEWLNYLLGFPLTEESTKKRSQSIYFWFKATLEPLGIVTRERKLYWIANKHSPYMKSNSDLTKIFV